MLSWLYSVKQANARCFRELKDINYLLQTYKLTISSKTGQGIKMEGAGDEKLHSKVSYCKSRPVTVWWSKRIVNRIY